MRAGRVIRPARSNTYLCLFFRGCLSFDPFGRPRFGAATVAPVGSPAATMACTPEATVGTLRLPSPSSMSSPSWVFAASSLSSLSLSSSLSWAFAALSISSMSLSPSSPSWAFTTFATFAADIAAAIGKVMGVGRVAGGGEL